MKINFRTKFKGKIHFVKKKGLKETLFEVDNGEEKNNAESRFHTLAH